MVAKNSVGIDYHNEMVQVCVLTGNGEELANKRLNNDSHQIALYCAQFGEVGRVAVESCDGAAAFGDELKGITGWNVELAHPGYVRRMKQNPDKSDYSDARLVGDLSRVGYLPRVWLAPERLRDLRSLVRYRQQVMKRSKNVKLRIRSLLRTWRVKPPKSTLWSKVGRIWLKKLSALPEQSQWILSRHLREVDSEEQELRVCERRLRKAVKGDVVVHELMQHKGIGFITAVVMRAEIGEFSRFSTGKQLSNYCGVTPRNASSGNRIADVGLVKSGNPILKTVVIEAAHRLIRYEQRWRCLAMTLMKAGKPRSVATAAVANRWIRWLHRQMTQQDKKQYQQLKKAA